MSDHGRLLLPDIRSPDGCERRFEGRRFRVVYTTPVLNCRVVLPPLYSGDYSFTQAVQVACDVFARAPNWPDGEGPTVMSVDGGPSVSITAAQVMDLRRVVVLMAGVEGVTVEPPPPAYKVAVESRPEDDEDF